jgi:hypothetical protein
MFDMGEVELSCLTWERVNCLFLVALDLGFRCSNPNKDEEEDLIC